jgi:HD-like signal output (HDOD) protein
VATDLLDRLKRPEALLGLDKTARRVLDLLRCEEAAVAQVAQLLSSEPGLASRWLRFVNSPLWGAAPKVCSIPEAVELVGARRAKLLALGFSLVSPGLRSPIPGFELWRFWTRSLCCAVSARAMAERSGRHDPLEAFLVGLLMHLGQVVLVLGAPEEYARVLRVAEGRPGALGAAEHAVFGVTHVTLGARVFEEWRFPPELCKALIEFPTASPGRLASEAPGLPEILHAAELAAAVVNDPAEHRAPRVAELLAAVEVFFSWDEVAWAEVFGRIAVHLRECGTLFGLETPLPVSFQEIQAETAEPIAEFTLGMHVERRIQIERQRDLLRLASVDRLTAVGNRAALDERLGHELDRARRTRRPVRFCSSSFADSRRSMPRSVTRRETLCCAKWRRS